MRKIGIAALAAAMSLSLVACAGDGAGGGTEPKTSDSGGASTEKTIGVAMPEQTIQRWINDGKAVKEGFEAKGYKVDLQYAGNDTPKQQQQIDQMILQGVDLLIVAAIDGSSLGAQLEQAKSKGIPVIAYDRLITGTENVDFYVTFDNKNVGVQQGTALLKGLGILDESGNETGEKGPFNIELFGGSNDDNNAHMFFEGAMSVLQPHIDAGTLVVKSGQTTFDQVSTPGWDQAKAQERMDTLIASTYSSEKIHGVYASNDGLGRGAITSLQNAGYTLDNIPVVTGQDAEVISAKWINEGWQHSSIFKDTRKLANQSVLAGQDLLDGKTPEINDNEQYHNQVKVVPAFLLEVDVVYKDNIKSLLVDSGYYTQEQIDKGSVD